MNKIEIFSIRRSGSKENYLKQCGRYFRYMRKEFDYTQIEFAIKCGVRQQTISKFERGVPISSYSTLKILSYLNRLVIERERECLPEEDPTSGQIPTAVRLRNITFKERK